jgi:urea carboxylase
MFGKVLIANRGGIACRIERTLARIGVKSVAVYSDADRHSLHVEQADEAVRIGPAPAVQSYLSTSALLEAAKQTGAMRSTRLRIFERERGLRGSLRGREHRIHRADARTNARLRLKHTARRIARESGLPLLPGTELLADAQAALDAAERIGYPVMLKSTAGGGGIGMRLCRTREELAAAFEAVARLSQANFGTAGLYIEKFVENARHIEVQIFGDGAGGVVALGERDCSAQRRNQKVIEETPAPGLRRKYASNCSRPRSDYAARCDTAPRAQWNSSTTTNSREFYFLEVNTRLQVEHGVTEETTGIDLVEWMVRRPTLPSTPIARHGCSIQVRLYAEDPARNFQPVSGRVTHLAWPAGVRIETWIQAGTEVTPYYDPMLAKLIVYAEDRAAALAKLRTALDACEIAGLETNLDYLRHICADAHFAEGGITTSYLSRLEYRRRAIEVIEPVRRPRCRIIRDVSVTGT